MYFPNVQLPIYTTIVNTTEYIDREGRSIDTPHFSDNDTLEAEVKKYLQEYISAPSVAQHFSSILHFQIIVRLPM